MNTLSRRLQPAQAEAQYRSMGKRQNSLKTRENTAFLPVLRGHRSYIYCTVPLGSKRRENIVFFGVFVKSDRFSIERYWAEACASLRLRVLRRLKLRLRVLRRLYPRKWIIPVGFY